MPDPADAALADAADALARRVLDRLPAAQAHGRAEIAALPSPLARVLLARLDARVDREAAVPASDWLDADRTRDAAQAWQGAARDAARVPAAAWVTFLSDGCRLALSHAVRPAETLAAVAFEDDGPAERPAAHVFGRLGAFEPTPYLPEIASRYAERKGLELLDRASLEGLFRRIDRRMVETFSADEWADALAPLAQLCGPAGVPDALLFALFEAKGSNRLARAVAGAGPLTLDAIRARLADVLGPPPAEALDDAPAPPVLAEASDLPGRDPDVRVSQNPQRGSQNPERVDQNPERADLNPQRVNQDSERDGQNGERAGQNVEADSQNPPPIGHVPPPTTAAVPSPAPAADDEPLWMRMMDPAARHAAPADPIDRPTTDAEPAEPLWKRFMPRPAAAPDAHLPSPPVAPPRPPLPDVLAPLPGPSPGPPPPGPPPAPSAAPTPEALLTGLDRLERAAFGRPADAARRDLYITDLFGGSEADYGATLVALARDASWTEATDTIARDVFRRHRVSPLSDAAVAFMDDVESRFRPA